MADVTVGTLARPEDLEPNLLDRMIGWVSPKLALQRLHHRARAAVATRFLASGYHGGRYDRTALQEWSPYASDPDAAHLPQATTLRARSRDLTRNSPLATGAVNTSVTSVVGTGLRVRPQVDAEFLGLTEDEADTWERAALRIFRAAEKTLDLEGELSFGQLQNLVFRSALESGDVLPIVRMRRRPEDLVGTKLQIVEADRISNPQWRMDTDRLAGGVEIDAEGRVLRYHVADRHPGSRFWRATDATSWTAVEAWGRDGIRRSKLLFDKRRPGQRRGVPYLAPVIEKLKQLDRYSDAELAATVVSSLFTVFVKTEAGDGLAPYPEGTLAADQPDNAGDVFLDPGAIHALGPGESIETADPNRPNQAFDPFVTAMLRQIGVALELPFEVLVKHFQSSYSAARAALLEAWRFFRVRRHWLATEFCQWTYELVISEAVARGMIDAPGFFDDPLVRRAWLGTRWTGDSPGQIDPLKEGQASALYVREGFSTIDEETSKLTGGNWEENHRQRAKEARMRREAGLDIEPTSERVRSETVDTPAAPDPDEDDEAERREMDE